MREIVIIGNNKAGQGHLEQELAQARETLGGFSLKILTPQTVTEFQHELSLLDPEKTMAVIAMGGDGTQNLTLRTLAEKNIPLIPFPLGTANDLATSIGLTPDWKKVKELLQKQNIKSLDLIDLGGKLLVTGGGLGLGADLLCEFNQGRQASQKINFLHRLLKGQIYTYLSVKIILKKWGKGHRLKISSDEFSNEITTAALFICNQPFIGKDLLVAPEASVSDGKMDIMIIPTESNHKMLWGLTRMKLKNHPQSFISFKTKKINISHLDGNSPLYFGDGEVFPLQGGSIQCEISPLKLKVFNF